MNTSRKLTIMGLVIAIVVACLFLHWRHVKISQFDTSFRQTLAGTWSAELDNIRQTNTVMPDGSFTDHLVFIHPGHTNTYQMTGTWLVKDGGMIETVNSDTNPTARTPRTIDGRILRANAGEFAVRWGISPDVWVWKKVIP
jgi:hypothetical protein